MSTGPRIRRRLFRSAVAAASALVLMPFVALGSASPAMANLPQPPSVEHITVVMVLPPGAQADGTTVQDVVAAVNGPVAAYWSAQTRGAITVDAVAGAPGWVTTTVGCDALYSESLFSQAAAAVPQYNPNPGHHLLLYIPPGTAGSLAGCANGYGQLYGPIRPTEGNMYVRSTSAASIDQQFGHLVGLTDSQVMQCEPDTLPTASCETQTGRDPYDVMGAPGEHPGSLNVVQANYLGVLPSTEVVDLSGLRGTRDITLTPVSSVGGTRAVRYESTVTGQKLWLEYRSAAGQDSWLGDPSTNTRDVQTGVLVQRESFTGSASTIYDPTRSVRSGWTGDMRMALTAGQTMSFRNARLNVTVRSISPTQAVVRLVAGDTPLPRDLDHNGSADVVAVDSGGTLYRYASAGDGFGPRTVIGHGWQTRDLITMAGDWDGRGNAQDVIAREPATGNLWLYSGNGRGGLLAGRVIGHGWQTMSALFSPGDWDGDGNVDLLARRRSDGALLLYPGDGAGGFETVRQIGRGWNGMTALIASGVFSGSLGDIRPQDFTGSLGNEFLARSTDGTLYLYVGDGQGGFLGRRVLGHGWQVYRALVGTGDWNGDATPDVLAQGLDGTVRLYRSNAALYDAAIIGRGWQTYRLAS